MSEEQIIQFCSPTLAGIKTGNLFRCKYNDKKELMSVIRSLNRILAPKGVNIIPVCVPEGYALIYVYRPSRLREDLSHEEAVSLLESYGYEVSNINCCLTRLCGRLRAKGNFPHEIGLFLGYPPSDVRGFIESPKKGCKLTGVWKVYGDEENAAKKFEVYRRCEEIYKKQYRKGRSLERLTVADSNK